MRSRTRITGERRDTETVMRRSERGGWKSTLRGNSLAAYSTLTYGYNGGDREADYMAPRSVPTHLEESQLSRAFCRSGLFHLPDFLVLSERTALVNQVRGLLAERGIVIVQGITRLRKQLPTIVEDVAHKLTPLSREVMRGLSEELVALDEPITRADHMVQRRSTSSGS